MRDLAWQAVRIINSLIALPNAGKTYIGGVHTSTPFIIIKLSLFLIHCNLTKFCTVQSISYLAYEMSIFF